MTDLTKFYFIIGFLVVSNVASIVSIIYASFRLVWWLSNLNATVKDHTKDIAAAHQKIRSLEKRAMDHAQ